MKSKKGVGRDSETARADLIVQAGIRPTSLGGMRDHRSLRAWQEAHVVSVGVIRVSRDSWKPYAAAVFSQLQRSSLSVELNIAEGYSFGNTPTFTRHLGIAYGSAVETVELLKLGMEAEVLPSHDAAVLLLHANRCSQLLLGLLKRRRRFHVG